MESAPLEFFKRLLDTPSPSGYEKPVQDLVRDYLQPIAETVDTDLHGNVIGAKNIAAPLRVMYAGHCDQIGMLVSQIDEAGFIYAQTIGGWDPQQLIGQRMVIWTATGPVPAVIARKPIHLLSDEERKTVVAAKDLWLDIGAKDQAEAKQLIRIGDPVTLKLGFQEMRNGLANAPKMDNTTGLWVVLEALRRAGKLNCALYSVSTVQEEIGLRGAKTSAHGINPHVGIGVDVTHATDCPTIDKRQQGEVALGKGPVIYRGPNMNPKVVDLLIAAADDKKIPYQLAALGKAASNDSNALQMAQAGVAAGCVAIPNRYMHSAVEVVSLEDLDNAATLLARFAEMIEAEADFRP